MLVIPYNASIAGKLRRGSCVGAAARADSPRVTRGRQPSRLSYQDSCFICRLPGNHPYVENCLTTCSNGRGHALAAFLNDPFAALDELVSCSLIKMTSQDRLREKWPWHGEFLRLFLLMPSAIGITATVALFPIVGVHSLWFLTAILAGIVLYLVYGAVGRRVENLMREFQDDVGELAEGLLVIGKIHSPGVVVLRDSEVELVPIVGKRCVITLADVKSVGEGRWLPGKFVWGKRAFTFNASIWEPLAFAVPESIGIRWSPVLRARGVS